MRLLFRAFLVGFLAITLLIFMRTVVHASSVDWPQFHFNSEHTGFNQFEQILSRDNLTQLILGWANSLSSGQYPTSPVIYGSNVYVVSGSNSTIHAYNKSTGANIWTTTVSGGNSFIDSSPAVANNILYINSSDGHLYALDASSGAILWFANVSALYEDSSPAVADGIVYVGANAFNAITGDPVWSTAIQSRIDNSPAVANGKVYFGTAAGQVYAVDSTTGNVAWIYSITGIGGISHSSAAVSNGIVYIGAGDHNLYALDAENGSLIWTFTATNQIQSSPAIANGLVYFGAGNKIYALNANNGNLVWFFTTGSGISAVAPAIANGVVYMGANDNKFYALNSSNGTLLWSYTVGAPIDFSSPAVSDGKVYIGVGAPDSHLYAFHLPNVAPDIHGIDNSNSNEGSVFSATGSFSDTDSSSWTGTVDYGDGSGPQSLDISGNIFSLNHEYADNGNYSISVSLIDNQGAVSTKTFAVLINNLSANITSIYMPNSTGINNNVELNASFTDQGSLDTHTATIDWGDGNITTGLIIELNGSGNATGSHSYSTPGNYTITVSITDKDGGSTSSTNVISVTNQLTALSPAKIWLGLKNSDDVGIKFDLLAEAYINDNLVSSGELDSVAGGSNGFNNANLQTIPFDSFSPVDLPSGSVLGIKLFVRNACSGSGHNSGTARLWYNDTAANTQFGTTIGQNVDNYFLVDNFGLSTSAGIGPKKTVDIGAGLKCSPYKTFGSWSTTP